MSTVRIQGEAERLKGIYFEFDPDDAPLGEGGMGMVYKGWCCSVSSDQRREVAIKFLYSDLPPHVIARARREADVQLRNDNLCEMLGFVEVRDQDEIGRPVIRYHVVSEYLHGVTLDKLMEGKVTDHRGNEIPYAAQLYELYKNNSYEFALQIVIGVLSGLIALHDAGYIHRDIDPSNVMITSDGKIKLIDFGIAKKINSNNSKENQFTVAGQFMGKPKYAAPELVRGLIDSQKATTDLYAVGILLYQLVVGHVPFDGDMHDVLDQQLNHEMPLGEVKQKQLRNIIKTATQKKRELRFRSAAEFRVALEHLIGLPYPEKSGGGIPIKIIGIIGAAVAALFIITAVIVGYILYADHGDNDREEEEENVYYTDENGNQIKGTTGEAGYQKAITLLEDKATAESGLKYLEKMSDDNAHAAFLLSRLYFSSPETVYVGAYSDSVNNFKKNLSITPDNAKAHELLRHAVALDGNDYRSLFELGCDYKSHKRGATFNQDSAYIYLDRARTLATNAKDDKYINAISGRISNLRPVNK